MVILHLGKYDDTDGAAGGIEYVIKECTRQLSCDFEQVLVLFSRQVAQLTEFQQQGIRKIILPVHFVIGFAPVNFILFFYLNSIIKKVSPDIIHVHMPGLMPFFCLNRIRKMKSVVHWHADVDGTKVSKSLLFPFYKLLETQLLKAADSIIATSFQYLDSSRTLKRFKQKCRVIPLGVSAEKKQSGLLSDNISRFIKNKKAVVAIGRLTYYKGFIYLIRAMKHVNHKQAVLVIAGDGPEKQVLLNEIKRLRLADSVYMPGRISEQDKHSLLSRADVFCLPSIDRAEAFGVALLEAMQHGLPLLTTRVKGSGMNHVNIHNQTGLTVRPADERSLADALNRLLDRPDISRQFAENSQKRFDTCFRAEVTTKALKMHYQAMIQV